MLSDYVCSCDWFDLNGYRINVKRIGIMIREIAWVFIIVLGAFGIAGLILRVLDSLGVLG
jgi:hypothetical protein